MDMMRKVLNGVQMDGVVVIGEGEKDEVSRGCVGCAFAGLSFTPEVCASALSCHVLICHAPVLD